MTRDALDDLLDRSAPATRAADEVAYTAMIREARTAASSRKQSLPRPRRRRVVLTGGALALVLAGGAGVAAATDGFNWDSWLEDPLGAYSLTLPSGLECSVRIAHYTGDDGAVADDVNRIVKDWWRTTDVAAEAEVLVPSEIAQIRAAENTVYDMDTGTSEPGGYGTKWYDADWEYHLAFSNAIAELEQDLLDRHGYATDGLGAAGLEGGYGINCFDENGAVVVP